MAMIAITTSSSIRVKAKRFRGEDFIKETSICRRRAQLNPSQALMIFITGPSFSSQGLGMSKLRVFEPGSTLAVRADDSAREYLSGTTQVTVPGTRTLPPLRDNAISSL